MSVPFRINLLSEDIGQNKIDLSYIQNELQQIGNNITDIEQDTQRYLQQKWVNLNALDTHLSNYNGEIINDLQPYFAKYKNFEKIIDLHIINDAPN